MPLVVETLNTNQEQNDYEIPWSLRDIISHFFGREISEMQDASREWHQNVDFDGVATHPMAVFEFLVSEWDE